jgi:hypothetical protein
MATDETGGHPLKMQARVPPGRKRFRLSSAFIAVICG